MEVRQAGFALLFAVITLGVGACSGAGPGTASEAPSPSAQPASRPSGLDRLPPKTGEIVPNASEPDSIYCCGNSRYKLEIDCDAGLMRCYELVDGIWHYTYGRHCKKHLSPACYFSGCDDKCE